MQTLNLAFFASLAIGSVVAMKLALRAVALYRASLLTCIGITCMAWPAVMGTAYGVSLLASMTPMAVSAYTQAAGLLLASVLAAAILRAVLARLSAPIHVTPWRSLVLVGTWAGLSVVVSALIFVVPYTVSQASFT